jgi:hypothetical protein
MATSGHSEESDNSEPDIKPPAGTDGRSWRLTSGRPKTSVQNFETFGGTVCVLPESLIPR